MSEARECLTRARRWVVKIGSALITDEGRGLDRGIIRHWVAQIAELRQQGIEVVVVSSGAIAEGMNRLGWQRRPHAIPQQQAAAAVGQMGLVQAYEAEFREYGLHTAQLLLTNSDLSNRRRYLNARGTLNTLLSMGVVPIVNENDTVVTDEIKFGDNDTLGALVANLTESDLLVILTDQKGLFNKDPRHNPDAELVECAKAMEPSLLAMAGPSGSQLGKGGMQTKVLAGQKAARSGANTVIASGKTDQLLPRLMRGENVGTLLLADCAPLTARKQWLANQLAPAGAVVLDPGACRVLRENGSSLLSVGIVSVQGDFRRGELVECLNEQKVLIAKGLINYNAEEARRLVRQPSHQIEAILGYVNEPEMIHRDHLVVL